MSEKLNIYEKIQAVSNEIKGIEKDMTIGTGQNTYKAVSDKMVILKVNEAERKYKLLSIPMTTELVSSEVNKIIKYDKEAFVYVDNIKLTTRIVDLDNIESYIDVTSYGKGVDPADKGLGKASTYARKYALLNAYKLATGEDPDMFKSEEQLAISVDEKRVSIENFYATREEVRNTLLRQFSAGGFDDLSKEQVLSIYNGLKHKGKL